MGCCGSRFGEVIKIERDKLKPFIRSQQLDELTCKDIRSLKPLIYDKASFETYSKDLKIPVPFELVENNGKVFPLELKVCLLLFSKDPYSEKLKLFKKIVKTDRQKLRFFEWRYQLINDRIPKLMKRKKEIDENERELWIGHYRIHAGHEIKDSWTELQQENFQPSLEILSVN